MGVKLQRIRYKINLTSILWLKAARTLTFAMLESICMRIGWPSRMNTCLSSDPCTLHASTKVYGTKKRSGLSELAQQLLRRCSSRVPGCIRTNPTRGTFDSTLPPRAYGMRDGVTMLKEECYERLLRYSCRAHFGFPVAGLSAQKT